MSVRVLLLAPVLAGALACRDGVAPDGATVVSRVAIAANPNNVLSAVLSFSVRNADSVRARYSASGDSGTTPFYSVKGDAATITIVGLRPSSRYAFAVEAVGRAGTSLAAAESTTTGALPVEIRSLHLAGTGAPSEPYTLVVPIPVDTTTDAAGYVLVFDAAGEIRWYRRFPGVWPIEAKQQRNGHITVYVGRSFGWQPVYGHFEELTLSGDVVRTYAVARPYYTDPHELLLSFADTTLVGVHMLGYELKSFDLSAVGGSTNTPLAVHTVERQTASGLTEFRWSAGLDFTMDDWPTRTPPIPDLDHPSSLAIDRDGNYVVSFQAMDQIVKVDRNTSAVLWRLGGRRGQFRVVGDPLGGFAGQHDVNVLDDGHLLLMDNHVRTFGPARAVEYRLDTSAMTATMVWEYRPSPTVVSMMMGSVERRSNGATLVGFGAAGRIAEVNGSNVTWSATLEDARDHVPLAFYRATGMRSLYR